MHDADDLELAPRNQFLPPELALTEMARVGAQRACRRSVFEVVAGRSAHHTVDSERGH